MFRILAYPFIALMGLGVVVLSVVLVWSIAFDGKASDAKGIASLLFFIVIWSWAAVSAYKHEIKRPRKEERERCLKIGQEIAAILVPGIPTKEGIERVSRNYQVVGLPRHRPSTDPRFDVAIELETKDFTVWLFGKDGIVELWDVT